MPFFRYKRTGSKQKHKRRRREGVIRGEGTVMSTKSNKNWLKKEKSRRERKEASRGNRSVGGGGTVDLAGWRRAQDGEGKRGDLVGTPTVSPIWVWGERRQGIQKITC